jgi:spore coat protein I
MYDRYLARCRDRARSLRTYSIMAEYKLRRTAMDREFLASVGTVLPQAENAAAQLEAEGWPELAAESREQGVFAYRRVGQGGVVIADGPGSRAVFVDWGGCRRDCHLTDLARLAGRAIRSSGGDGDLAASVVTAYNETRTLSPRERALLPPMLAFPDRYFELARRYYEHKRDWPENSFVRHLRRVMQDLETQTQSLQAVTAVLGGLTRAGGH